MTIDKTTCDDRELTQRAAKGDPAVFGDIIRCYQDQILSAARMRCGHPEDAKDVLQDTYVAAMRYLPGFRGEATVRNWMVRLAMSACTKRRRGRKNDPKLHVSTSPAITADAPPPLDLVGGENPEHSTEMAEQFRQISDRLLQLNDKDRAVLLLVDGEGHTASETAALLDLTEPAVKSRLHRARKAIRQT